MFLLRLTLVPFALIYGLIVFIRLQMYKIGLLPTFTFNVPVVSVGNLEMGGAGKTELSSWIIRKLLDQNLKPAYLSRGFLRKTSGFVLADPLKNPRQLGDEAFMIYHRYASECVVGVAENRAMGIPELIYDQPDTHMVILDDAFQHQSVARDLNVLVVRYDNPFYQDHLLPYGRLREWRSAASRADMVVVTKTPTNTTQWYRDEVRINIAKYTYCPVVFTKTTYGAPMNAGGEILETGNFSKKIITVAGIAHSEDFHTYMRQHYTVASSLTYHDHVWYTDSRLREINANVEYHQAVIVCTEKDYVKLNYLNVFDPTKLYYLPIGMEFIEGEETFVDLLNATIKKHFAND